MRIGELGEDGILTILARYFPTGWTNGVLAMGDDAAVVPAPDARVVVTADTMNEGYHFRSEYPSGFISSGYSVGWKLAAQNLSDINGMGAVPTGLVLSLALPQDTTDTWLNRFAAGIANCCRILAPHAPVSVVGGDLTGSDTISVAMTALGSLEQRQPALRSVAEAADELLVVHRGAPGWAAAGFEMLEIPYAERPEGFARHARDVARAVRAHLRPRPALQVGPQVAEHVLGMMDVSDGIERDIHRIAQANGCTVEIHVDQPWIRQAADDLAGLASLVETDPLDWVLSGGEDYGLLAVVAPDTPFTGPLEEFHPIGTLRPSRAEQTPVRARGWDHFGG